MGVSLPRGPVPGAGLRKKFLDMVKAEDCGQKVEGNFVPRAVSLAWGRGGKRPSFPSPPPSQGNGPGNEVEVEGKDGVRASNLTQN